MIYRCGQKVVCINGSSWSKHFQKYILPIEGRVYTIRQQRPSDIVDGGMTFLFYEIENEKHTYFKYHRGIPTEPSFRASRFRPVVDESKTNIEVFRKMLGQPNSEQVMKSESHSVG